MTKRMGQHVSALGEDIEALRELGQVARDYERYQELMEPGNVLWRAAEPEELPRTWDFPLTIVLRQET